MALLQDVCINESSNLKQSEILESGEYPVFGASGLIGYLPTFHQKDSYVAVIKDGAGIGRTVLLPKNSSIIGTMQYLIPKNNVLPEYLYYVVKHMHLEKYYTGATIPHIYFKNYKNEEFHLSSIEEQKNIINNLQIIEKVINNQKKLINKMDELVKARFVEMFEGKGFEEKRIDEVCSLKSGTTFPHEVEKENGDILYCKVSDMNLIGNEKYMEKSKAYVSNEVGLKTCMPPETVIFPKRGGAIGTNKKRITLYQTCVDLNTMGVIHGTELNVQYLYYYFIKLDLGTLCDGSAVPQLNNKNIGPLKIAMPPIDLQNQFAEFVKQVDKSKLAVQQSLEKTQQLFDSLMQEYFG